MPEKLLNKRNNVLGHIFSWIFSIAFFTFIFYLYSTVFYAELITKAAITNIGLAISVYINLYVLIPKLLKKKSYIFYIFWLVLTISASSLFVQFGLLYPFRNVLHVSEQLSTFNANIHSAFFIVTLVYVAVSSFLKFVKDWIAMQDLNYKLAKIEKQKLQAELNTLKGQLNPHFLFNSLNNIYSLALIQSKKVPDLILKLSDLMRHIIYESKENFISLDKEIEFVDNFIALQQIRISENTKLVYVKEGRVPDAKIVPLLFEPFIDNAFKHGVPGNSENDFIKIRFEFTDTHLHFKIENNFSDEVKWNKKNSGIGIQNVKQRLSLLYKKNEYNLLINKDNHVYCVELNLQLR
ncbi:sensor histidine kinase [Maribellus mangrovi]|uniref:sensor histidine kinase n=1 Tax=Maribellus mangrovi TaxID=3133146 RepID=UPI0030EB12EB